MIELLLLRHAKSSWSDTELPDMDRPLSKRGKQAAQAMGRLLDCIRARGGKNPVLMVVGHNPSMERLAQRLVSEGDPRLRQRMERKYPTAALAVIGFDLQDWSGLEDGAGTLQRFVRPRDIMPDADD